MTDPAGSAAALGRLHLITDGPLDRVLGVVEAALVAGVPVVQVRAKAGTDRELVELAGAVVARCREHGAQCLVDDRVDVGLAVGADGSHLGADDLPLEAARALAGPGYLLGGTARDPDTARRLVAAGADYLGVGPAYRSDSKADLPEPIGVAGIAAVAAAVPVPVVAIGGITADRVPALLAAGAYGVAVIGAVARADDPGRAVRELLDALSGAGGRR